MSSSVLNIFHKSAVIGLIGLTLSVGTIIPTKLYDVNIKAKELKKYAEDRGISYEQAGAELGYAPVDERWKAKMKPKDAPPAKA
mmetsp:Transcript_11725/g.30380  ORF Transcript_11725/g.30380 Transcript_11725/m.30380 type:complete len:84 (-) Transcript_11725:65-316(-)